MSLTLRLELLSDAAPGSGTGGPAVDRDVVSDDAGLPVIPGRRLKGLLREAGQEAHEAFALAGQQQWLERTLCSISLLFGTPFQAGLLRVGDARFAGFGDDAATNVTGEASELAAWLRWAGGEGALFGADAVLRCFTVVRTQTAIDSETGAAQEHALRSTRLLRRGLHFVAPLDLAVADEEQQKRAVRTLALACAALRRLGTARSRGPGKVRARLWDDEAGDRTALELQKLGQPARERGAR